MRRISDVLNYIYGDIPDLNSEDLINRGKKDVVFHMSNHVLGALKDLYGLNVSEIEDFVIDGNKVYIPSKYILYIESVEVSDKTSDDFVEIGGWFIRNGRLYFPTPIPDDVKLRIRGIVVEDLEFFDILENNGGFGPVVL